MGNHSGERGKDRVFLRLKARFSSPAGASASGGSTAVFLPQTTDGRGIFTPTHGVYGMYNYKYNAYINHAAAEMENALCKLLKMTKSLLRSSFARVVTDVICYVIYYRIIAASVKGKYGRIV